jgi:hypothetical protein
MTVSIVARNYGKAVVKMMRILWVRLWMIGAVQFQSLPAS